PTLSNGSRQTSIQNSIMAVPPGMGSAAIQTALSDITVLDSYGRDFTGSVAALIIKPGGSRPDGMRRRVAQMGGGGQTDMGSGPVSAAIGFASYRTGPRATDVRSLVTTGTVSYQTGEFGVHAGFNAQDSLQLDTMGLAPFADGVLAYTPQAGNSLGIERRTRRGKVSVTISGGGSHGSSASAATLGWSTGGTTLRASFIDESGSVMGMPSRGALKLGRGASTTMIEAHQAFAIALGWSVESYGSLGVTRLKIDDGSLVTGASGIIGTRIGLQAKGPVLGGTLSFGVAQPLIIESGSAELTYGTGYDLQTRSLVHRTTEASLAGERRLQLTAGFATGGHGSSFRVGVMQDVQQGATSALAGTAVRF
ncbi:MAG TPA: peptidase S8 and S53, subtilisin, kexin,sedolisin, partial [Sphingomonas sp.]